MELRRGNYLSIGKFRINILLFYSFVHILFFAFGIIIFNFNLVKFANDGFLFYWNSSYSDFQEWFPNYDILAYSFIKLIGIAIFLFILLFLFRLYKPERRKEEEGLKDYFKTQLKILIYFLGFYLLLYFLSRIYLNEIEHAFFLQRYITQGFLIQLILQLGINGYKYNVEFVNSLKRFLLKPVPPYNIALLRIFFFCYLGIIYLQFNYKFSPTIDFGEKAALPLIGFLIDIIPVNLNLYNIITCIGVIACLFIVFGYKTKYFLILNALCCFYLIATPNFFGKLWHFQLLIWISWFFTFAKCYDVLSIDSYFSKTKVTKSSNYSFPIRFIWIQFGIIYFWAGFYKLWDAGFDWALNKTMINQVHLEWLQNYDEIPTFRIDNYPLLLYVSGFAVIIFELSYIAILFTKFGRWVVSIGGIIMHSLIYYFMYISFFNVLVIFYVFYIDFNAFFKKKLKETKNGVNRSYSKLAFYSGVFILCMNFTAGMVNIDTYPFSAYPKYSAVIPDEIEILCFRTFPNEIDIYETAKRNNFKWENYGWLENNILEDFKKGENVNERIDNYWQIWVGYNKELRSMDSIQCYIIKRPVAPIGRYNYYKSEPFYTFVPED